MIWNQIVKVTLIMKLIYIHFAFAIFAFEVTLLDFLLPIKAVIFIYFWAEVWWWQKANCNNPASTITRTVFFTSNISSRRISDPYRWTLKSTMSNQVLKKLEEENFIIWILAILTPFHVLLPEVQTTMWDLHLLSK